MPLIYGICYNKVAFVAEWQYCRKEERPRRALVLFYIVANA